jgi:hyperosmotically inducible periplasmic protein
MSANHTTFAVSLTVASVLALSVIGCDRQQATSPSTPPAPSTTVGTQLDDSVVTTRVKSTLLGDADIKSFDIGVETRKGEVQLSGFVDNQTQIDRAIEIARGVEGVKSVTNKMSIKK